MAVRPEEVHREHGSVRIYWVVFAALMALLGATMLATLIDIGPLNIALALTIATIKAVLIILYFMHVRHSSRLIWLAAGAAFFWVGIMLGFVLTDYISRPWLPIPGR
jgi:cytochrome c oxidase subunit IV